MKKILFIVVVSSGCLFSISEAAFAQPQSTWRVGFHQRPWNFLKSILSTPDQGWIAVGSTDTNSLANLNQHGWIVKLDSNGKVEWQSDLGQRNIALNDIIRVGNQYIIAGTEDSNYFSPFHGGEDAVLICIDTIGNTIWSHAYGGTAADNVRHLIHTRDGGFVMTGETGSRDGDVSGYHPPPSGLFDDLWILKTDSLGNLLSEHTFGGAAQDFAGEIRELPDGTLETYSNTNSFDGDLAGVPSGWKVLLLHLDSTGAKIAQSFIDLGDDVSAIGLTAKPDGNVGVGLLKYSTDALLGRAALTQLQIVQPNGLAMIISDTVGLMNTVPRVVAGVSDGTTIFAGYTNSDSAIWIARLDSTGHTIWLGTYFIQLSPEAPALYQIDPSAIAIAHESSFVIAGRAAENDPRLITAFVDRFSSSVSEKVLQTSLHEGFRLYPNPCMHRITARLANPVSNSITLILFDDVGVMHGIWHIRAIPNVPLEVGLDVGQNSAGSYRLQIFDGKEMKSENLQIK